MSVKDILAVVPGESNGWSAGNVAFQLAEQCDAHLSGVAVEPDFEVPAYAISAIGQSVYDMIDKQRAHRAEESKKRFQHLVGSSIRSSFEKVTGTVNGAIERFSQRGLLSDLVVISQQDPNNPDEFYTDVVEASLFQSGRPVLLVPYIFKGTFKPNKIILAWDGGASAAHALHAGMDFLEAAEEVLIVQAEKNKDGNSLATLDVAEYLARHNVNATVKVIKGAGATNVGNMLLNMVTDEGADMLMMGAYQHSRTREFFLGGTTKTILDSMTVPVLMAH